MELRIVEVLSCGREPLDGSWWAHGLVYRYGEELSWDAFIGPGDVAWKVTFRGGQTHWGSDDAALLLVYEGDPPAADEVRRELRRILNDRPTR